MSFVSFQSPIGFHLYDRETNQIIPLQANEYDELLSLSTKDTDGSVVCTLLEELQEKDFCMPSTLKEIKHPQTDRLETILSHRLQGIVLQLTQSCNLRCSYCAYSGKYYNRNHNPGKVMSTHTAELAVDFLMKNSDQLDGVNIGFYGGEPLLEIDLIKHIVNYIKEEYYDR